MDKKTMSKIAILKKVCRKSDFSYANNRPIIFSEMRAFSRKITFSHFLHFLRFFLQKPGFSAAFYKFGVFQNAKFLHKAVTLNAKTSRSPPHHFETIIENHRTEKTPLQTSGHFRRFLPVLNFMQWKSSNRRIVESSNWSGFAGSRTDGRSLCARSYNRAVGT